MNIGKNSLMILLLFINSAPNHVIAIHTQSLIVMKTVNVFARNLILEKDAIHVTTIIFCYITNVFLRKTVIITIVMEMENVLQT